MSPKKFWELSWYDLSIWSMRIKSLADKRKGDQELLIELERNTMALMVNSNPFKKKGSRMFKGQDFYKMSYDTTAELENLTPDQTWELVNERFGRFKKFKKRG